MKKCFVCILGMLGGLVAWSMADRPNIIIIFTDDQGYQDLGCYGSPNIKTPHIDQLAKDGTRFTDFYVGAPVCSASRASLLTGCYPHRVGVLGALWPNTGAGLDPAHTTIAEVLKTAGYATKMVGKWHLGDQERYLPMNQGFDSYFGIPYSNDMFPALDMVYAEDCVFREGLSIEKIRVLYREDGTKRPASMKNKVPLMRDGTCIELPVDQRTITKRYTDESLDFISECATAKIPFFLYLAHTMPHTPLYVSPEFEGKSARGLYGDVIEEIDHHTGRLIQHLKKLGMDENTLVVYTSDNGPWLNRGDHGGSALPLARGKKSYYEGGLRVPGIMRWPARIPAGRDCSEMVLTLDLLPTIASLTRAELPEGLEVDGRDVTDVITGKPGATTPHKYFFYGLYAVRSGDWKYYMPKNSSDGKKKAKQALFNLKDDIGETTNLIEEYPEIVARLAKALEAHKVSMAAMQAP